jgi:hypothetical protein
VLVHVLEPIRPTEHEHEHEHEHVRIQMVPGLIPAGAAVPTVARR